MPIRKKILFCFLIFASQLIAQTIRPNHWIDADVRYYWNRKTLWELSPLERPYTGQEILAALDSIPSASTEPGLKLVKKMPASSESEQAFGWIILDNAYQSNGAVSYYHAMQRAGIGAQIHPKFQIYGSFYVDNQLDADTLYIGKQQSGVAAFMEQAYILFQHKGFRAKFGRDYLVWGPGLDASLHISAASQPMDHLYLSWQNRWIKLSFFTATLDKTEYPVNDSSSVQNRYLSGHRIEFFPLKYLRIGLNETALFGGPDAGNDFALINPVQFYGGIQLNGPQTANILGSLDAAFMPLKNVMLYSSLMIDDIQIESESQDDMEPGQYGYLAGFNWADPLKWRDMDLFAEYTRVTNRTYNGQGGMWEKYLHRNVPIGHFLGNDFDRALFGLRYRPKNTLRFGLNYEHRRRGEGRISDAFTTPWRDIPSGQTYSEPFPTGIVEISTSYQFTARWQPWLGLYGDLFLSHWQVDNVENQTGINDTYWEARISLSFEFFGTASIR